MTLRADIATGETTLDRVDLRVEGAVPLVLSRRYRSGAPVGIFGLGWEHGLDRTLRVEADRVVYREGSGQETVFAPVPVGMEARHPSGLTLQHHADGYVVFASPLLQDVFRKGTARGRELALERIVDANGNRLKLGYAQGRLATIAGSGGQQIQLVYTGGVVGQVVVAGADGRAKAVRTFRFGSGGALVAETDSTGRTVEYGYHDGLLVRVGTKGGAAWFAQYDATRRCTALWRSDGTAVHHLSYDDLRQTTRAIALDGRQTIFRHVSGDEGTVVIERIDTESKSCNYFYDAALRLRGYADATGTQVAIQNLDAESGEFFQMDYGMRFTLATVGPSGLMQTVGTDAEAAYAFTYDERFNVVQLTTPLGSEWTFARDPKGRASAIVCPAGRRIDIEREGHSLAVRDTDGVRLKVMLDLFGRTAARTDRLGRSQRFRYDDEGRLVTVEVGDDYRVAWEYDAAGRLARVADTERNEILRTYDGAGRVLTIGVGQEAARFTYDLAGRISVATGPEGDVHFEYNEQDLLVRAAGPRQATSFDYDDERVTLTTGEIRRVYNTLGELVEERTPGGTLRTFAYEPGGELYSIEEESGEDTLSIMVRYDADGRLALMRKKGDAVTFEYDAAGLLTELEGNGRLLRVGYDARLRPQTLGADEAMSHLTFDDGDRLVAFEGDGVACTLRYDALDRCVAYRSGAGAEVNVEGSAMHVPLGKGLAFFVARHSLSLVFEAGAFTVPLWGHDEMRLVPLSLGVRAVRGLVLGPSAVIADPPQGPGPPVEQWIRLARAEGFETGVPNAASLRLPWPTLDLFALSRDRYDPHFARRYPGVLPSHQPDATRSPDVALSGSHCRGTLHARAWAEREQGRHLQAALIPPAGGIPSDLALRLYHSLMRS